MTPFGQARATVRPSLGPSGARRRDRCLPGLFGDQPRRARSTALGASVIGLIREADGARQADGYFGNVDREDPAVAGHVPIKLVELVEAAELAIGAVVDPVDVRAGRHIAVRIAQLDADAALDCFLAGPDRLPIKGGVDKLEADANVAASRNAIADRKVAKDAVIDPDILGRDLDRLGDVDRPVLQDGDVALKALDPFLGGCRGSAAPGPAQRALPEPSPRSS